MRDPLPYSEGVPGHIRQQAFSWLSERMGTRGFTVNVSMMIAHLAIPEGWERDFDNIRPLSLNVRVQKYCQSDDDAFLDVLDYILQQFVMNRLHGKTIQISRNDGERAGVRAVSNLAQLLDAGRSCWRVGWTEEESDDSQVIHRRYCLERRVTEAAESEYLRARGIGGKAGAKLTEAWHAAYGRTENPEQCWKASVAAVEAVLQPVVSPQNPSAGLGAIRGDIRAALHKWECDLPVWGDERKTWTDEKTASVEAFLSVLNRVTYEKGRHGGDDRAAEMREARAVLMVAVTIVEWVRDDVFRSAKRAP